MGKFPEIKFSRPYLPKRGSVLLLVSEGCRLSAIGEKINNLTDKRLSSAMKTEGFEGKSGQTMIVHLGMAGLAAVTLMGIGDKTALQHLQGWRNLGAQAYNSVKKLNGSQIVMLEIDQAFSISGEMAASFGFGFRLASYQFNEFKSSDPEARSLNKVTICTQALTKAIRSDDMLTNVAEGVFLARDLVNMPPNRLGPQEFADQAKMLTALDCEVKVINEASLQSLGMNALLAVGKGSRRPPCLVTIEWKGFGSKRSKPLVLVGKGVVFDSGGISIKPAGGMEDMKGDMGGAAAVLGALYAAAKRKSPAHVIGVLALAENMPDGNAYRPGDIVTSLSEQTIEVINTDAEGRLVLADALWYAEDTFKPKAMINLATLTGAIMVALGQHTAGLFSNSDALSKMLVEAGKRSGEPLWPMPMGPEYDKLMDSRFADMKNSGGRYGGAVTAAQFLKRFVRETDWAHLDIAGTAFAAPTSALTPSWGAGFGVQLLNDLIIENFE